MTNLLSYLASSGTPFSKDLGLFVLRIAVGIIFTQYGFDNLFGGKETWRWMGSQLSVFGISCFPVACGLIASCIEAFGGLFCIIGFKMRIVAPLISFVMLVAIVMHNSKGESKNIIMLPLSFLIVFASLAITGAGRFSVDYLISKMWC